MLTLKDIVKAKVKEFLIEKKGYPEECVIVDYPLRVEVDGKSFISPIDILIRINGENSINIECAPPMVLASLERKALAVSRIIGAPITVVTDWEQTKIYDTESGRVTGNTLEALPSYNEIEIRQIRIDEERLLKEKRILFAYIGVLHCECAVCDLKF